LKKTPARGRGQLGRHFFAVQRPCLYSYRWI